MTTAEQDTIHDAATESSRRLIKAADLVSLTACQLGGTAERKVLEEALKQIKDATECLAVLFVELNRAHVGKNSNLN